VSSFNFGLVECDGERNARERDERAAPAHSFVRSAAAAEKRQRLFFLFSPPPPTYILPLVTPHTLCSDVPPGAAAKKSRSRGAGSRAKSKAKSKAKAKAEGALPPSRKHQDPLSAPLPSSLFARGPAVATKSIADKKLRGTLRYREKLAGQAQSSAAAAHEWLLPSQLGTATDGAGAGALEAEPGSLERTWRVSQRELVGDLAPRGAAKKALDLSLPATGPYSLAFTPSGRSMVIGGRRGHLAVLDAETAKLGCEVFLRGEGTVRDVSFLHNDDFFAVAQGGHGGSGGGAGGVFIYDRRGAEVHAAREHAGARRLAFLRNHFLLSSIGDGGVLRWQDVTTGQLVGASGTGSLPTRQGDVRSAFCANPHSAVVVAGHANGVVSMWSPNCTAGSGALVKILAHRGPVLACAVDARGLHLVTSGADGQVRVFDVRTFRPLHSYLSRAPASDVAISQRGVVAVGAGRTVTLWKDALGAKAASPYMRVDLSTAQVPAGTGNRGTGAATTGARGNGAGVWRLAFRPYEDVLAVGHSGGVALSLVPGAGEPNYDSRVADPYATLRQRREGEVRSLLDKLPPESIVLDPTAIGRVAREPAAVRAEAAAAAAAANAASAALARAKNEGRAKMKGKNKPTRRQKKKQFVIIEEKKASLRSKLLAGGGEGGGGETGGGEEGGEGGDDGVPADAPRALHRLYRKF